MTAEESYATEAAPTPLEAAVEAKEVKPRRSRRKKEAEPDDFDQAIAAQQAEPPAGEPEERQFAKQLNAITDDKAKMKCHFNYETRPQRVAITFDEGKLSDEVRQTLKDNGFRWNPDMEACETPIRFETRGQDRADAIATFREVADMGRIEKGLEPREAVAAGRVRRRPASRCGSGRGRWSNRARLVHPRPSPHCGSSHGTFHRGFPRRCRHPLRV